MCISMLASKAGLATPCEYETGGESGQEKKRWLGYTTQQG